MVVINTGKIKRELKEHLNVEFEAAPHISKAAYCYRDGDTEYLMNTGGVQRLDNDGTGKKLKTILFRAGDVETSEDAIRKIYKHLAPANDKLNIEIIVAELERKLNFRFNHNSRVGYIYFDEKDKKITIDFRIHWSVNYFGPGNQYATILHYWDVASANEAIEKISDFLMVNFNSFKAHLREQRIDEIFAD